MSFCLPEQELVHQIAAGVALPVPYLEHDPAPIGPVLDMLVVEPRLVLDEGVVVTDA